MYWALTVIAVCQAAYISVISDGCCSMGRGRKSRRGGGGKAIDRKERWGAGESFLSLSTVCDHWSAALLHNAISQ